MFFVEILIKNFFFQQKNQLIQISMAKNNRGYDTLYYRILLIIKGKYHGNSKGKYHSNDKKSS